MNPIRLLSAAACVLALAVPGVAGAAVYKCTAADGKTSYQSLPCGQGQGGRIEVKPAQAVAPMNPQDRAWLQEAKPAFNASCLQGMAVANARNGAGFSPAQVSQVCNCVTQRYYSGVPAATLRSWQLGGDSTHMQERLDPINQACVDDVMAGQSFSGAIGGAQNVPAASAPAGGRKDAGAPEPESILRQLH